MPQSNINTMYEGIVADLAERAKMIMNEPTEDRGLDETEYILQAIDEGLIYYSDEAYVIAHAYTEGLFRWNEEIYWENILETLIDDISDELKNLKEQD